MKEWMLKLLQSLDSSKSGLSARKLSAFWAIVIMSSFITIYYTSTENAPVMLGIWLTFAALCLSIVTIQQVLELKQEIDGNKA